MSNQPGYSAQVARWIEEGLAENHSQLPFDVYWQEGVAGTLELVICFVQNGERARQSISGSQAWEITRDLAHAMVADALDAFAKALPVESR